MSVIVFPKLAIAALLIVHPIALAGEKQEQQCSDHTREVGKWVGSRTG